MSLQLAEVMRQWRWAARIELKTAAAQIGISDTTLSRFERGENTTGETLARVIRFLLSETGEQGSQPPPAEEGF